MRHIQSRTLRIVGLMLLLGSARSWAAPPNPTVSDASGNTAGGTAALLNITTGVWNTAFGQGALYLDTMGYFNTAIGLNALISNTSGAGNTASGLAALGSNTVGNYNTADGLDALHGNTTGSNSTAIGTNALLMNQGTSNGDQSDNTAVGAYALQEDMNGSQNTAVGTYALYTLPSNPSNFSNTAVGWDALDSPNGSYNTSVGATSQANGEVNTAIGYGASTAPSTSNATALGYDAMATQSNSIQLGNGSITHIFAAVNVITISDRRLKKDIRALDSDLGLDFIEKLKPVSYRINNGDETERYGFVAQDLEQALPTSLHDTIEQSKPEHGLALIERGNDKDRTYHVSYSDLLAPIVKALQQQQQEITADRKQNADLRHALEVLGRQVTAFKAENDALRHSVAALREQQVSAAR
jgi:trimeric autotransporter adhesin